MTKMSLLTGTTFAERHIHLPCMGTYSDVLARCMRPESCFKPGLNSSTLTWMFRLTAHGYLYAMVCSSEHSGEIAAKSTCVTP